MVPELIRETDPDVLLAMQAVNHAALEHWDVLSKRLAQHIVAELAQAWK